MQSLCSMFMYGMHVCIQKTDYTFTPCIEFTTRTKRKSIPEINFHQHDDDVTVSVWLSVFLSGTIHVLRPRGVRLSWVMFVTSFFVS